MVVVVVVGNYMGFIYIYISQWKDPYKPISISWNVGQGFVLPCSLETLPS